MKHTHNPDDRRDNVEKIQRNINNTMHNSELAREMIAKSDDDKEKKTLQDKNDRRKAALTGMREEIKDEAIDKQNGYK
jgi:small acid-soluble spore protein (thioredoxin-like protein)